MSDPVKDDDAELEQLLERYAARLPLHANDTPDYAVIIDAKGENPALTTEPELILAINALPRLLAALRASREREERLRRALQERIADLLTAGDTKTAAPASFTKS